MEEEEEGWTLQAVVSCVDTQLCQPVSYNHRPFDPVLEILGGKKSFDTIIVRFGIYFLVLLLTYLSLIYI